MRHATTHSWLAQWMAAARRQYALVALAGLAACTGPAIQSDAAVRTSDLFHENRVFYVRPPQSEEDAVAGGGVLTTRSVGRQFVEHGAPFAIVLNSVYLPSIDTRRRDIAVVLDITSGDDTGVTSLVVWYQTGVPPGQRLNFQDLLVYADSSWHSDYPPYFRVRVLDVSAYGTTPLAGLLTAVHTAFAGLGNLIPEPHAAAVAGAARFLAEHLTGEGKSPTLIDLTFQAYSDGQIEAAGGSQLLAFTLGPWAVVGRPPGETDEFWRRELSIDPASGRLQQRCAKGMEDTLAAYARLTVMEAQAVVPAIVARRSARLNSLLQRYRGTGSIEELNVAGRELMSALRAGTAVESLRRYRRGEDFKNAAELVTRVTDRVMESDEQLLLATLGEYMEPGDQVAVRDRASFQEWWSDARRGSWRHKDGRWSWGKKP